MGLYDYRKFIANELACRRLIRRLRWPKGIKCPHCKYSRIWKMQEEDKVEYRCKRCNYHFSDISGTIFEKTTTPFSKWIMAIGLFKIGISANKLKDEIHVTYETAWNILRLFRRSIANDALCNKLSGEVEVDETYIGGKRKGMRGRGAKGKTAVVGIKERNGKIRSIVIPDVSSDTLRTIIKQHVAKKSLVYTDKWRSYNYTRRDGYHHHRLDHNKEFVRGKTHTQGIEGHWGHLKPTIVARYRKVSPKYLQSYLDENDFKFNERKNEDFISNVLRRLISYPLSR